VTYDTQITCGGCNPTIFCPFPTTVGPFYTTTGCDAVATFAVTASEDCCSTCSPPKVTYALLGGQAVLSGSSFSVGLTTIVATGTDDLFHTTPCTFEVKVEDLVVPGIVCPAPVTFGTDATICGATVTDLGSCTVSDACGIKSTLNDLHSSVLSLGIQTVTWTTTDVYDNTASCVQTITVQDTTKPTIVCPSDTPVQCNQDYSAGTGITGTPTVSDNCDLTVTAVASDEKLNQVGNSLVIKRTWTATDVNGNVGSCVQTITVTDTTKPKITCPAPINVFTNLGCSATIPLLGSVTVTDDCDTAPKVTNNAPATFPLHDSTVTWTAVDANGNSETCTQLVTVSDSQLPTISCPQPLFVSTDPGVCFASSVALDPAIASDNCDVPVKKNNAPSTFPLGPTAVTWTATDASNNVATCTASVTVSDTEKPTIACPAPISVVTGSSCTQSVVFAAVGSDNCKLSSIIYSSPSGSYFNVGTTTVVATATDKANQQATCSFTVTVTDPAGICALCSISWGYWKSHDRRPALANCGMTGSSLFYPCGCMSSWAAVDQGRDITKVDSWDELILYSQVRSKVPQLWQLIEQYEAAFLSLSSRGIITCSSSGSFSWGSSFVPPFVKGNFTLAYELVSNCPFPSIAGVAGIPACLGTPCTACTGTGTCSGCPPLLSKKGVSGSLYGLMTQVAAALEKFNTGLIFGAPHC
jgi:hypothetical protein